MLLLIRVLLAEQEQAKIVDSDGGSYTHRKCVSLKEAGEQVLMPQIHPSSCWLEESHRCKFKDIAHSIPHFTSGKPVK